VTPRVWRAAPDEAAAVAALMSEFRDWQGRDAPVDRDLRASVARLIEDPATEYLLASAGSDGGPDGVCQLRFRYGLWYSAEDCWLEDLFVREPARGGGVGAALVAAAEERARARGCLRIDLDAASDNHAAQALYRRFGFAADTDGGGKLLLLRRLLPDS
jgi:GNAT superfamily N-acetyltransferase